MFLLQSPTPDDSSATVTLPNVTFALDYSLGDTSKQPEVADQELFDITRDGRQNVTVIAER